jgi:hypothetical protein
LLVLRARRPRATGDDDEPFTSLAVASVGVFAITSTTPSLPAAATLVTVVDAGVVATLVVVVVVVVASLSSVVDDANVEACNGARLTLIGGAYI